MPNFNSIGSGVSEPQVAENRYLPLTGGIALTTVYALTCYTVMFGIFTIAGIGNFIDLCEKLVEIVILVKLNRQWALEFTETRLLSH